MWLYCSYAFGGEAVACTDGRGSWEVEVLSSESGKVCEVFGWEAVIVYGTGRELDEEAFSFAEVVSLFPNVI